MTKTPELVQKFHYLLLPKEPALIIVSDAYITAKSGSPVTNPYLPSGSNFKVGYAYTPVSKFTFFNL